MFKKYFFVPFLLLGMLLVGCQSGVDSDVSVDDSDRLQIVATFPPLTSMTKNLVGDRADVYNLVPAGTSVHAWEPKPSDVKRVAEADLVIANGLGLEEFLDDLLANTENPDVVVVDTSEGVETLEFGDVVEFHEEDGHDEHEGQEDEHGDDGHHEEEGHHHHDGEDPHVWLSPVNAQLQVSNIADALVSVDEVNAAYYQGMADTYLAELVALDESLQEKLVGKQLGNFIVFHDAYQYFLNEYDLLGSFIGAVEEFPGKEPSPAYLKELTELIEAENVAVVFTEPQFSPTLVNRLQEEYSLRAEEIDPIGSGTDAGSYIANIEQLLSAFEALVVEQN